MTRNTFQTQIELDNKAQFCKKQDTSITDTGYREELAQLVLGAQAHDIEKTTMLITELYPVVLKFSQAYLAGSDHDSDLAEDITQQTLVKAIKKIDTINDPMNVRSWAKRIAENNIKDYWRSSAAKNNIRFSQLDDSDEELEYDPADERVTIQPELLYSDQARQDIIMDVLANIPLEQREVLLLKFYENLTIEQIAEHLSLPVSTVTGRLAKGKKRVKLQVEELQKRDGIKLYGLSPLSFFIVLLRGWRDSGAVISGGKAVAGTALAAKASVIASECAAESVSASTAALTAASNAANTVNAAETIASSSVTGTVTAQTAATAVAADTTAKTAAGFWTAGKIGGAVVIAAAGVAAVPVYNTFIKPEPKIISIEEYTTASFSGFNGDGSVHFDVHTGQDSELNELLNNGVCIADPGDHLNNGDVISVACTFAENSDNYVLENTEYTVTVSGLEEYLTVDLFYGVDVIWQINEEEKTVSPELVLPENDSLRSQVTYSIAESDEAGNITVHADGDPEWFRTKGYLIAQDGWDRTYAIGEMPDVYASEKAACASQNGTWNDTDKACEFQAVEEEQPIIQTPVTSEVMTAQGQAIVNAAYAQLGSTDLCSLVVNNALNAIGVDCFVGDPASGWYLSTKTIRDHGYWVATPQPGDVAYYSSNYSGTDTHVAIYIGNGQVISGNFNGSTQIVAAYIGGQQSQPEYYRYY